jgi:hypothetical protein
MDSVYNEHTLTMVQIFEDNGSGNGSVFNNSSRQSSSLSNHSDKNSNKNSNNNNKNLSVSGLMRPSNMAAEERDTKFEEGEEGEEEEELQRNTTINMMMKESLSESIRGSDSTVRMSHAQATSALDNGDVRTLWVAFRGTAAAEEIAKDLDTKQVIMIMRTI